MPSRRLSFIHVLNSSWQKMSIRVAFTIGILGSMIACVPPSGGTGGTISATCTGAGADNAIIGGTKASQNSWLGRSLVFIQNYELEKDGQSYQEYTCTGTLIDRNLILTAAHCVNSEGRTDRMKILFTTEPACGGRMDKFDPAVSRLVSEIRVHPNYKENQKENDLALLKLTNEAPTEYQPIALAGTAIALNPETSVLLAGFGKSVDYSQLDPNPKDLKFIYVNPLTISAAGNQIAQMNTSILVSDQRKGKGACAGDSGGPAFTKNHFNQYVQIGVASQVVPIDYRWNADLDTTCHQGIFHISVLYHRQWIEQNFRQMNGYYGKSTPFVD